jgi:CheY-like chemotaxis protein
VSPSTFLGTAGDRADGSRRRILVIEDNPDTAITLRDVLELEGHEVHIAADGLDGVAAALRLRPEVVVCDIGLPGIDGYEVARRLQRSGVAPATLIALTGYASPGDLHRAAAAGFQHHLGKPADLDQLSRLISGAGCAGAPPA